jgi:hypothetical protein
MSVLGCLALCGLLLIGCTSTEVMSTARPAASSGPALGPPPGYVKPENYWVREKIILGEITTVIEKEAKP